MLSTNATNGATVAYRAIPDTSGTATGRLKIAAGTCAGSNAFDAGSGTTDPCFNSSTTQTVVGSATGTEQFGMTIAGIGCYAVPSSAYTCDYTAGNVNLRPQSGYIGGTFTAGSTGTYNTTTGFTWQESGATVTIASSAASTVKVVSNEALVLKFGARASVTTPTGSYTTQADFIATPTF
jgi:hypothetical protein